MMPVSVVVLAGGKSTRMGRDKAFLPWGDKTFLEHILDAAKPISNQIILSGSDARLHNFGLPVIADVLEGEGPVVALASCFIHIKTDLVLVLSCDVPQVKTADLEALLAAHNPVFDVTMFSYKNREMPLVAVYQKSSFGAFAEALKVGERKLFAVLKNLKTQSIAFAGAGALENINTMEEFKELVTQSKTEKTQSYTEEKNSVDLHETSVSLYEKNKRMELKFFGMLAEVTGKTELEIQNFEGKTVADVKAFVETEFRQLKKMTYKIAVNKRIVSETEVLNPTDEVAFLPPFAGG